MNDWDPQAFGDALIKDMRSHGGAVTAGPLKGHPLLVMSDTGARTGMPRRAILTFTRDKGAFVVAGTAGGSPTVPAWVHNVRKHPVVAIEVENRTFAATATVIARGPERDRLWGQHVAQLPWFAEYSEKTKRIIPIVRLEPTGG